jgi:hypothetical protein
MSAEYDPGRHWLSREADSFGSLLSFLSLFFFLFPFHFIHFDTHSSEGDTGASLLRTAWSLGVFVYMAKQTCCVDGTGRIL